MDEKQNIGWIGLGKMGNPMSRNLLKAGYPLTVYDIVKENCGELVELGAKAENSPKAVAAGMDVIISMIPDDHALEAVSIGPDGAFRKAESGTIFIDMSTVSPVMSARVSKAAEEKGIMYLRSPVSGSTEFAEAGTLTVLVSGPEKAYEQCKDIFNVLGQKCFYVGKGDEARYLKLLINMMVGITSAMTAEALTFGKRGGLEWNQMVDLINNSVVGSPLIGFKVQLLKEREFPPAFTAAQMAKDFDLALHTGRSMDIPMPITAFTRELYGAMKATGKGELDYFGLVALMEEMAGIKS
jgi:3-hydroxyisobutyrate dehydrogenase-like beta-hydroxyacid dehydrogenase